MKQLDIPTWTDEDLQELQELAETSEEAINLQNYIKYLLQGKVDVSRREKLYYLRLAEFSFDIKELKAGLGYLVDRLPRKEMEDYFLFLRGQGETFNPANSNHFFRHQYGVLWLC